MATPREPLTAEQMRRLFDGWHFGQLSFMACSEPTPHTVNYRAGRCWYHAPEHFPLLPRQRSPSDCVWIVPGTLEKKV